ncbi:MAG: DUF5518 domain-containing protein [Haloarculaceae archaeon]
MSTTDSAVAEADQPNTLVNALLGGVAAVVLAFLPFSTVLGGALAGYLQGPDTGEGLKVGALAGVVAVLPLLLVAFLFGGVFLAVVPFGMGMVDSGAGIFGVLGVLAIVLFLLFGLVYTVGLSALGGILGAYLNREL